MKASFLTGMPVWPRLTSQLRSVVELYQRIFYAPDPGAFLVTLATYAAFRLPGDPCWVMLVGSSSGGKTESMNALRSLGGVYPVSTVTPPGLLSGTSAKNRAKDATGGLLSEIGASGFVVVKDFTSILSQGREVQKATLAALREIYDGRWDRKVGVDGGRTLSWQGRLSLIAGCTTAIDDHSNAMSTMGERFIFYRLPKLDGDEQEELARRAAKNAGLAEANREAIAQATADFFASLEIPSTLPDLDEEYERCLEGWASLTARCRSAVTRNGYTREIEMIHDPEAPARLVGQLRRLEAGLKVIGVPVRYRLRLVRKTALDCIPPVRFGVLSRLAGCRFGVRLSDLMAATGYPRITVWRTLEDLRSHRVVRRVSKGDGSGEDGKDGVWEFEAEWLERWSRSSKSTKA